MKAHFKKLTSILSIAAVYFLFCRLGLDLAFENPSATPVWPGTGIAFAVLLLWGYRNWPGIFLGAFLVNFATTSLPVSLGIAVGNTLEALIGVFLVNRFCHGRATYDRPEDIFKYVALVSLLSTAVSATIGVLSLSLGEGRLFLWNFQSVWMTWWLGDAISSLLVAPFLVICLSKRFPPLPFGRAIEAFCLVLFAIGIGLFVFGGVLLPSIKPSAVSFLALPILAWAAFRFGQHGAISIAILISGIAILGTLHREGPFAMLALSPDQALLFLEGFMATITVTALVLAAAVLQRGQIEEQLEERVRERTIELRKSENRYRDLVELSPDAILVQCEGKVVFLNSSCMELFGAKSPVELLGTPLLDLIHPDYHDIVRERMRLLRDEKKEVPLIDEQILRLDGKTVDVAVAATPVAYLDKPAALMVIHDLTERHRLEGELRQAQKMKAIGQLAGGIAHDFNNVLASIKGYAKLALQEIGESVGARDDLQQILNASNRAKELVERIQTFSRHSGNTGKKIPCDLAELVRESIKLLRPTIPATIAFKVDLPSDLPIVTVDSTQIHQILLNLCINSSHAMPNGGELVISLRKVMLDDMSDADANGQTVNRRLHPRAHVLLSVMDSGEGIPKENLTRIFEPFFTTKTTGKGSGMGLSVVFGIVKNHGGTIRVESVVGKGTTFKVYLPASSSTIIRKFMTEVNARGGNESLLVVDDDPQLARMIGKTLTHLGYSVVVSTDSEDALNLFINSPKKFDMVITDQTMPGMTGDKLAEALLRTRPDLPIILCSGYSELSSEKLRALDQCSFVKKPFADNKLELEIRKRFDQAKERQSTPSPSS